MRSLTNLKVGDNVKMVVSMVGNRFPIQNRITDSEGRVQLLVDSRWFYADSGNAVNGSLAYITGVSAE